VRSRKSSSDFDRLRRAQEAIIAISMKLFSLNALNSLPEVYAAYRSAVVTDIILDDVIQLLPLLQAVDLNRVDRYQVDTNQATPWIDPNSGAYYLLPQTEAIQQLLRQAVSNP
jgi:anionic cell wall polymer biosynthesis LytR-Cps2A-Psr (LCP) family protein